MQRLVICCAWLLALSPAPALAAPEEKENLYEIEVLVFENRLPQYLEMNCWRRGRKPYVRRPRQGPRGRRAVGRSVQTSAWPRP